MIVPKLPAPSRNYNEPVRSVLVLGRLPSPTVDIYLRGRLEEAAVPVRYEDVRAIEGLDPATVLDKGCFVIVVRYLTARAAALIEGRATSLSGVAFLMDDDMPAALSSPGLALPYRLWLAAQWRRTAPHVARLASEIWLSSDGLERRYGNRPHVHRVNPLFLKPQESMVRIFCHAISSHEGDALWLRDVVAAVQEGRSDTLFEIIGHSGVRRAYENVPRCEMLAPLRWPHYLARATARPLDIGLAPLEPSDFNAGRSYTKFFDITRAGAVGIYSDQGPYGGIIRDGVNGLLRPQDQAAWIDGIHHLADDTARRRDMHCAAQATAHELHALELGNQVFDRFR